MDGVHVELASEPGFSFTFSETEHTDARNKNYGGIRIAHGRGIRLRERVVIFRVLLAIILQCGFDLLAQSLHIPGRLPGDKQRPDLGADKVVGTAGAEMRQRLGVRRIYEAQDFRQIAEVADQAPGAGDSSPQERKNVERKIAPVVQSLVARSAEQRRALLVHVVYYKLSELIDDGDRIFVALLLRVSPGEQAVATQHNAVAVRTLLHRAPQHHGQLEARTLPRHPNQMVFIQTIEFFHLFTAVGRGRQRDTPVRMQMVNVGKGQKAMKRRINRGSYSALAEGAQRIHVHHFIFEFSAAIFWFQTVQLF